LFFGLGLQIGHYLVSIQWPTTLTDAWDAAGAYR